MKNQNSDFQRSLSRKLDFFRRLFKSPSAKLGGLLAIILILSCIFAPYIAPYDPYKMNLKEIYKGPSLRHLFGTDAMGRDIFSRMLYGGRYSLTLAFMADVIGRGFGCIVGCIAGYFGKTTETIIMRLCDIWSALPGTLLAILISASLGSGFVNTMLALAIGGVPSNIRLTRGQIVAERGKEYLEAAESINCSRFSIMFGHLLPNVISPTIVSITMGFGQTLTRAASLSYLGLGVQPPTPEWGAILSEGTNLVQTHPYLMFFPGLVIALTVFAMNLVGDGLRDALDPKLRD